MKIDNQGTRIIRTSGGRALHELVKEVIASLEEGYILNPEENNYNVARKEGFSYRIDLIKAPPKSKGDLEGKTPEEIVAYIQEDESKDRLLDIAESLGISLSQDDTKYPKRISKILTQAIIWNGTGLGYNVAADTYIKLCGVCSKLSLSKKDTDGLIKVVTQILDNGVLHVDDFRMQFCEYMPKATESLVAVFNRVPGTKTLSAEDLISNFGTVMSELSTLGFGSRELLPEVIDQLYKEHVIAGETA